MIAKGKSAHSKPGNEDLAADNVVSRLRHRLHEARATGFKVRMEVLDDEQASWCVIAGVLTLFVDLSQTASEQLQQVEETLNTYHGLKLRNVTMQASRSTISKDHGKQAA